MFYEIDIRYFFSNQIIFNFKNDIDFATFKNITITRKKKINIYNYQIKNLEKTINFFNIESFSKKHDIIIIINNQHNYKYFRVQKHEKKINVKFMISIKKILIQSNFKKKTSEKIFI